MAARLNWVAPASDGGSPIIDYRVERSRASGAYAVLGSPTATTFLDTSAEAGDQYRVAARNAVNLGSYSGVVAFDNTPTFAKYVAATGGSDSNPGTLAQPYATLQKLWDNLAPGQIGRVGTGTYTATTNGGVILNAAPGTGGTSASVRKTLYGEPGQPLPVIRGVVQFDSNFSTLQRLHFQLGTQTGSNATPFRVGSGNNSPTGTQFGAKILDCIIDGQNVANKQGILLGSSLADSDDGEIARCIIRNIIGSSAAPGHGVYAGHADAWHIHHNVMHTIIGTSWGGNRGIQLYPHSDACLVEYNTIDECSSGIVIGTDSTSGTSSGHTLRYNLITNTVNGGRAMMGAVWNDSGAGSPPSGHVNAQYANNHHHAWGDGGEYSGAGFTVSSTSYNDPLYVNRAGRNYALQAGSPAAGKGAF